MAVYAPQTAVYLPGRAFVCLAAMTLDAAGMAPYAHWHGRLSQPAARRLCRKF